MTQDQISVAEEAVSMVRQAWIRREYQSIAYIGVVELWDRNLPRDQLVVMLYNRIFNTMKSDKQARADANRAISERGGTGITYLFSDLTASEKEELESITKSDAESRHINPLVARFTGRLREIAEMLSNGESRGDIAKRFNHTEKWVAERIKEMREILTGNDNVTPCRIAA